MSMRSYLMRKQARSWNSTLRPVSPKQEPEMAERRRIKVILLAKAHGWCRTCVPAHWVGDNRLDLSHKIPLSRGGLTDLENCVVECRVAHERYEKHPERRPK